MSSYVYLLENEKGNNYLGSTNNPSIRLKEHNSGQTSATKGKGPWSILKIWEFDNIVQAKRIEYKINAHGHD